MLIVTTGRGHTVKRPSKPAIGTLLGNLGRATDRLTLHRRDDDHTDHHYLRVRLCPNNTYELEHRDGPDSAPHRTRTLSQEKVRQALLDWGAGRPGWREDFMWNEWTPDATGRP
ncbi:hypothetical protein [Streptomyces sp. NPDC059575]|uniref:hypothetical protein n=1 Tax=Streptomyces sp. NPDC059575 TaxID=3346872 RepID=UPI0036A55D18